MPQDHRTLSDREVEILKKNGCRAQDWSRVFVKDESPLSCVNVRFEGEVCIGGISRDEFCAADGKSRTPLIENVRLKDCIIEDDVYIRDTSVIDGYTIKQNAVIENCQRLEAGGGLSPIFADVMNENGGRRIRLSGGLSAQSMYLYVFFRDNEKLIQELDKICEKDFERTAKMGMSIGNGAVLIDTGFVRACLFKDESICIGAAHIENCIIQSAAKAGRQTRLINCILQSRACADSGSYAENCLIAEHAEIEKDFNAADSVILPNSSFALGEALSIFAAPFSVSHHKSTLLIAQHCSFFNAGSGANASNHMYKLGAIHQGYLARGTKCGSGAYIPWASAVAPFCTILGKHTQNFNAAHYPFSVITSENGKTCLTPAKNLFTAGLMRDERKWKQRNKVGDTSKNVLNTEVFNPYTINSLNRMEGKLKSLDTETAKDGLIPDRENGLYIKVQGIKRAYENIRAAKIIACAEEIIDYFDDENHIDDFNLVNEGVEPYELRMFADIAGQIIDQETLGFIKDKISYETLKTLESINKEFKNYNLQFYPEDRFTFALACMSNQIYELDYIEGKDIKRLLVDYENALDYAFKIFSMSSKSEFAASAKTGYGAEEAGDTAKDFNAVVGNFDENSFINELRKEFYVKKMKAQELLELL